MATANKREVGFVVGVETTGTPDIQRLAAEVRKLGAEGDPAAAEFRALADQLDRLGQQADAVAGLRTLNADVDRLTAAQREATAAAQAAKAALEAQTASVAQLREQQTDAAQKVAEGVANTRVAADAVKALKRDYDAAGKATQEYKDRASAADAAVTAARNAVDGLRASLKAAGDAVRAASTEEGRLATAYLRTREAAGAADAAVRERAAALRTAETAATSLAVSTTDLAQADAQLLDSQGRLLAQLNALKAQQAERLALDQQNAAALQRTEQNVRALASAYELEQAALAEGAARAAAAAAEKQKLADAAEKVAAAERAAAAAAEAANAQRREQQEHDEQAAYAAYRLAEARKAAQAAAQSELLLLKDSEDFTRRYAQAQRDAAAAVEAEGVEAMRKLEQAARDADKAQEQLVVSLRATEAAAEKYAAAIGEAAAAGEQDVAAAQKRRAAAEALIASERELTAEQREAAQARDGSRAALIAEAQALLQAARAADESREATARLVQETLRLGTTVDGGSAAIRRMGTAAEQAFGTVGIRGLQQIEAEVRRVDVAMQLLERDFRAGRISVDDFARATGAATVKLNQLNTEARQVQALPGQFERISSSIQGVIGRFGALGAAVATVGVAVRPVIEATVALDQMRRTLTTVTGSADEAQRQIEFLRATSQQAGQSFTEVGQSYAKFAASALQSGLSIQQVQDVFKSVALAAGNLGLSSDQAKRALEALSQVASKGTVSMEELRQQLGDALPGVLPLLAKQLGLTQAELNKVVESGNLLAQEAIPAIGKALRSLQPQDGVVNGMVATWNRFINVVKEAGTTIVEGPLGKAAGAVITAFAGALRDVAVVAVSASSAVQLLGQTVGATAAFLAGGAKGFDEYRTTIARFADEAASKVSKFQETAYGANEGTKALAGGVTALGTSFASLSLEQQKAIDQTEAQVSSASKYTQAAKEQGDAIKTLAELSGDEAEARAAGVAAAELMVTAAEREATATEALLVKLREAKVQNEANAVAAGLNAEAVRQKNAELDKEIVKAEASAEKTRQQAEAYRSTATAVELAAKAAENNAGKVDTLRKNYEQAKTAVELARVAMVNGTGTMAEFDEATRKLAKAKGLLKDAIKDVSEELERELKLLQAEAKVVEAGLKLEIEKQKNALAAARAAGNEYQARQATIAIAEAEMRIGAIGIDLKNREIEATLRSLDAEEKNLRLLGQLTPERAKEIEALRKVEIAKLLENQATQEASKSKQQELVDLKNGTTARDDHTSATDKGTTSTNSNSSSLTTNSGELGKNAEALGKAKTAQDALSDARKRYNDLLVASRGFEGLGVTGNGGLAGIKEPGLTDVRAPGSRLNDSDLVTNNLAGTFGKASVNMSDVSTQLAPGMFAIDTTIRKGNGQYGVYNEGRNGQRISAPPGSAFGGSNTAAWRASKTVNVNLNVGKSTAKLSGSEADVNTLLAALKAAQGAS